MLSTILKHLEELGTEQTKKTYLNHGCQPNIYGVKVGDLKKLIRKYKLKNNHTLALELFATGNYDAMYLAGLISDAKQMEKSTILEWTSQATWHGIGEYIIAPVTAETPFALEVARGFIRSDDELKQCTGYTIFSFNIALVPDNQLDLHELSNMMKFIRENIHSSHNRTRYTMNSFVISVGTYVVDLSDEAYEIAEQIGKVSVDMGGTACKVKLGTEAINHARSMGRLGVKRKQARC